MINVLIFVYVKSIYVYIFFILKRNGVWYYEFNVNKLYNLIMIKKI